MPKENPKLLDRLTSKILDVNPEGMFRGAGGAAIGIALLSATRAVPEQWETWVQWSCFVIFAAGGVRVCLAIVWR